MNKAFEQIALVQGLDDETATLKGQDVSGTRSWLDVWALRDGRWVLIASHDQELIARSGKPVLRIDAGRLLLEPAP